MAESDENSADNSNRRLRLRSLPSIVEDNAPMDLESENDEDDNFFDEYLDQNHGLTQNNANEQFDTDLPSEHLYLGHMDNVSGLDYFECGKKYRIQVFEHHSILFPGETLPMIMSDYPFESLEETQGTTFGIIFCDPTFKNKVGVTCQVYEKGSDEQGIFKLKCRAHQRFIVLKQENGSFVIPGGHFSRRKCLADVVIQPDIELLCPLEKLTGSCQRFLLNKNKIVDQIKKQSCSLTPWPKFIYDFYDVSGILNKLREHHLEFPPESLTQLSYWLARNILPLTEEERYEIFITNNVIHRLIIIRNAIDIVCYFSCKRCKSRLASYSDIIAMSKEGIQSSYCNPNGYIHETMTIKKMIENSSYLVDRPKTEFSWFPGYAWQILLCQSCHVHIGWKFTAAKPNLVPRSFYGLSGKSLTVDKTNAKADNISDNPGADDIE